jgi:predicted ATPase
MGLSYRVWRSWRAFLPLLSRLYTYLGVYGVATHPTREEEAEACFLSAIEIARKQQAKLLELRAVMSLSRLWQQQGKKEEARQMLADIYGWFTEGFDTKDLQEAKALLEELERATTLPGSQK